MEILSRLGRRAGPLAVIGTIVLLVTATGGLQALITLLVWVMLAAPAFAIGFLLKRRWVALAPIAIAIALIALIPLVSEPCDSSQYECDAAGLGAIALIAIGLNASAGALTGAIAGRRRAATSAQRRSS